MKIKILGLLVLLTLGCSAMVLGQAITVDTVDGSYYDTVKDSTFLFAHPDSTIVFHIRMAAGPDHHKGITNGWRIYSTDGATWDTTAITLTDALTKADDFDLTWDVQEFGLTGMDSDTVGVVGAVAFFPVGMPADFDSVTHLIAVGPIDESDIDKHLCIDSCFYYPSGVWKWADVEAFPTWDGPYCYRIIGEIAHVDVSSRDLSTLPDQWSLGQNYPNPFNPATEIAFDVPSRSHVTLAVYNVLGQQVTNLVNETLPAGTYTARWDGTSGGGSSVASGVYFYRLETDEYLETKKMMLLK